MRGVYINPDENTFYISEVNVLTDDDSTKPWIGLGSGCQFHGGIAERGSHNQQHWKPLVETHMAACRAEYGYYGCELVISGHSTGGALALHAAGLYHFQGQQARVLTFGGVPAVKQGNACRSLFKEGK